MSAPSDELTQFKNELATLKSTKISLDRAIEKSLDKDLDKANNFFSRYVTSCGVNNSSQAYESLTLIKQIFKRYNAEVTDKSSRLRQRVLAALNVSNQTAALTNKYQRIDNLKKELEELDTNVSTAYTREAVIDTRDDAVSFHQTWGYLNRPLRRYSIPILIVFAIAFAGAGIYGLSNIGMSSEDGAASPMKYIAGTTELIVIGIVTFMKLIKQF